MKLFVFGLDGASYELINQFVKEGWLPTFKKLISEGKYSCLKSTTPPHTAPGWVSSLTGVNPGQHGIYQFWETQPYDYEGKFVGSSEVNVPFVWDILNRFDYTTGMINIPMSHPPKKVDGYILTWPLYNTLKYCYPPNLVRDIAEKQGHYVSDLLTMYNGDINYINEALDFTRARLKTINYLLKSRPTDFMMSVFTEIDRVSHFYWSYMIDNEEESETLKNAIKDVYIECDKVLGKIIDLLDEDTILMVYSDHGFQKCNYDFNIQSYLLKEGFLCIKEAEKEYKISNNWFECKEGDKIYCVDWDKTIAYMASPGSYGVNINLKNRQHYGIVDSDEYDSVRNRVIESLKKVRNPVDETPLFKKIYRREEIYSGDKISSAPDIILEPDRFSIMVHHKLSRFTLFSENVEQSGIHSMNGILLLYGKKLKQFEYREPDSIKDIAPTILKIFNIEKPEYMEGNSLLLSEQLDSDKSCAFQMETKLAYDSTFYSNEEHEEIKERLRNLGYL